MKSMLHEASSVTKAIEKAWAESGQPREFTINVLELGEKSFFGFTKRPAIVSITFDPKRALVPSKNERKDAPHAQRPARQQGGKEEHKRRDQRDRQERQAGNNEQRQQRPARQENEGRQQQAQQQRPVQDAHKQRNQQLEQQPREQREMVDDITTWTPELTADLHADTAALVQAAGLTTPYTITTDKRSATIAFNGELVTEADLERQLFMSMSYLLIQFLKKKHKKKLRGFHITITTTRQHGAASVPPAAE